MKNYKSYLMIAGLVALCQSSFAYPTVYNVTVQNNYYYSAVLQNFVPDASNYYPDGIPKTIAQGSFLSFVYDTLGVRNKSQDSKYSPMPTDLSPSVTYSISQVVGGCRFAYYADSNQNCIAVFTNLNPNQALRCDICQASYNATDNSCTYVFKMGGKCSE